MVHAVYDDKTWTVENNSGYQFNHAHVHIWYVLLQRWLFIIIMWDFTARVFLSNFLSKYTYQQNMCPLAHSTLIPALPVTASPWLLLVVIPGGRCTTPSHSTWGHHLVVWLVSTKVLISNVVYLVSNSLETTLLTTYCRGEQHYYCIIKQDSLLVE